MAHQYKNKLSWIEGKKGKIEINDKPSIEVAVGEEFGGLTDTLSPEDLFLASINGCLMSSFLYFKDRKKINIKSYQSEASATLIKIDTGFVFSEVYIRLNVQAEDKKDQSRIPELIELAKKYCIVSNSIKSKMNLEY